MIVYENNYAIVDGYKFNKDLRDSLKKVEDNRIIYPE